MYIRTVDAGRKRKIFLIINYIYASIEAVVYYPGFMVYTTKVFVRQTISVTWLVYLVCVLVVFVGEVVYIGFSVYLYRLSLRRTRKMMGVYGRRE